VTELAKAVFVDRDDTVNRDVPYCRHPDDFMLLPGVARGIKSLNKVGLKVVLITNQSGIARGYFTDEILASIHKKMANDLAEQGAHIDAIYYCPHHPDDNCDCRKPKPKLIYQAVAELHIDLSQSFVIGDRLMDIELATTVGCKGVIVPSGQGKEELKASTIIPDYVAPDFESAVQWVLKQHLAEHRRSTKRGNE
jgi:histidinol-phosphate phosphatase family protein